MLKKKIPWMILFVVIAAFSIWTVTMQSKNFSWEELKNVLQNINVPWITLAIISMTGFIFFEGFALNCLTSGLAGKKSLGSATIYGAADVYFSAITPSASGGQPASAFFMILDKIPAAITTVILLVNLIMYTFALLFCAVIVVIFNGSLFTLFNLPGKILILVGVVVLFILATVFWMLLKKEEIIKRIALFLIGVGAKAHILRRPTKKRAKLDQIMLQYEECSDAINGKRSMLFKAFVFNLLQRISLSFVTVFSYLAIGGDINNFFRVWSIQIFTTLGSNSVPIPGAMGVHDYLLLQGLGTLSDVTNAANLELISRGLSFYVCVIISALIIICGYLYRKIKNSKEV
ncbi:MAG: flippase-like domain-containing protein [Lachnospiraceae bacterium]|nr:flippase-like domain-containing protein [Lachnospiraceae bacterium]